MTEIQVFLMNILLNKSNYIWSTEKIDCGLKENCSWSQYGWLFWCLPGEGYTKICTLKKRVTQVIHRLVIGSLMMMIGQVEIIIFLQGFK